MALEERKRAYVALGLLSKEHRDLVTTLFQTLPAVDELGEPPELASQNATPPPVDNNENSRLTFSSHNKCQPHLRQLCRSEARRQYVCAHGTFTPVRLRSAHVCAHSTFTPVRLRSASKKKNKKRSSTGDVGNPGKKPRNSILNYFVSQTE